jgi:hypothetical protein
MKETIIRAGGNIGVISSYQDDGIIKTTRIQSLQLGNEAAHATRIATIT